MAGLTPGRSATRLFACAVVSISIAALLPSTASATSPSALEGQIDVAGFSERAASYASAHVSHRAGALQRAEELALEGQEAEAEREEEERLEALAATQAAERARATTTVPPTTSVAPTTAPPTTAPPTPAAPTTTAAATETATTTAPPETETPASGPTAEQWAALRYCESGGRYDAVNPNGRYRGAYQFSQATWDWVAGTANPSLIGVDPAAAAPADQDALALALYEMRGSSPWPTCGAHLQ